MNLLEIETLARASVNEPWGCGDPFLENTESSPPYYRFLNKVVKEYKPQIVIECGVYMATASVHMAIGNPDTQVYGIDKQPHSRTYSALLLYNNFHLIIGDTTSLLVYDELKDRCKGKVGLLFLDSEHDGETANKEFNLWKTLFTPECLVVCDDLADPRMKHFWDILPGEKLEMPFLHVAQYPGMLDNGFGVSIIRREE